MILKINWQKFWSRRGIINYLLVPLSLIFLILVKLRIYFYKIGVLKSEKPDLPVVMIGNINIGGSGKTPFVIALGMLLQKNNIKYAVISKGYGAEYGKTLSYKIVKSKDSAYFVGDEVLLIKSKLKCPVVVSKSRLLATKIVKQQFPEVQIILSDDGLQHYQLESSMKIAIVHADYQFGNNMLLPAGCLREPVSILTEMDFVIFNGEPKNKTELIDKYNINCEYFYILQYGNWHHINNPQDIVNNNNFIKSDTKDLTTKKELLAITGIAHPNYFFNYLLNNGIKAKHQSFPDHYSYTGNELIKSKTMLMTEKDHVKLKEFNHDDAWYLETQAVINDNTLTTKLIEQIQKIIKQANNKSL